MIKLINCKLKLEALGIYMEHIGSGALFEQELIKKIPNYVSWEYDFAEDQIKIWIEEGTEIPDMSDLGELAEDEFVNW